MNKQYSYPIGNWGKQWNDLFEKEQKELSNLGKVNPKCTCWTLNLCPVHEPNEYKIAVEQSKMTREEAIEKLQKLRFFGDVHKFIESLETLGLLKFDETKLKPGDMGYTPDLRPGTSSAFSANYTIPSQFVVNEPMRTIDDKVLFARSACEAFLEETRLYHPTTYLVAALDKLRKSID